MKIEILAPAGSMQALIAALRCGADAVYIGGSKFSARQNAANFSLEEIKEAVKLCHLYKSLLHVAVNTVCMDDEIEEFCEYIKKLVEFGVDAFIVQDTGAAAIIKKIAPCAVIHASTQMTIHSCEGAIYAKEKGFDRVVLAREMSREQIKKVCSVGIEVECFVHGALCMCVSGQCYMSAMIGQRSANRGLCAQSCRLPFSADKSNAFALSLKDLSLVKYISKMSSDGVCSLKIEGRMKRPEYVAAAVTALKNAVLGNDSDIETLKSVFSRSGFTDGYYTGKLDDMFGIRRKEDVVAAKDVLGKVADLYRKPYKKASVKFEIKAKIGENIFVKAIDSDGFESVASGEIPQIAQKKSDVLQNIQKQFSKLGDTIYTLESVQADFDEDIFVPSSEWNKLRRMLVDDLYKLRKENRKIISVSKDFCIEDINSKELQKAEKTDIWVQVRNESQLKAAEENKKNISKIIVDLKLANKLLAMENKEKYIISPPRFLNDENKIINELFELKKAGFTQIYCTNVAYAEIGKKLGYKMHGSFGLNITNSISVHEFADYGFESLMMSPELKISQINKIKRYTKKGLFAYGRLPLMLTKNCPVKNQLGSCKNCTHFLIDRTKRKMPVYCSDGMTEIFNSDRIFLADKKNLFRELDYILLYFIDESESETDKIIKDYIYGTDKVPLNSTNGLIFRGVQ